MKTEALFSFCSFEVSEPRFQLLQRGIVPGGKNHRHTQGSRISCIEFAFRNRVAVQRDACKMGAGKSMSAHTARVRGGRVVANKKGRVEARIEARHHSSVVRPGTHDANIL